MKCPKCGYESTMTESLQSPDSCPSCGVYYSKVAARAAILEPPSHAPRVSFADWVNSNPSVKWIGALILGLVVGYFAGREHVKYEIRSAMAESLAGLGSIFGGRSEASSAAPTKPVASEPKAAPRESPITLRLVSKGFYEGKYGQDEITTAFEFANRTAADIRAFDGKIVVTDLLGNEIMQIGIAINELVKQGQTLEWKGSIDYNQFKSSHQRFRSEPQENLKVSFVVEKVLYSDGRLEEF